MAADAKVTASEWDEPILDPSRAPIQLKTKLIVVGAGAVGKTTAIEVVGTKEVAYDTYNRLCADNRTVHITPKPVRLTAASDAPGTVPAPVPGGRHGYTFPASEWYIATSLWDTAGQEDYDRLRPLAYPQTDVFVLMYALDIRDSARLAFEKFIPEIRAHMPGGAGQLPAIPIVVVENKMGNTTHFRTSASAAHRVLTPATFGALLCHMRVAVHAPQTLCRHHSTCGTARS